MSVKPSDNVKAWFKGIEQRPVIEANYWVHRCVYEQCGDQTFRDLGLDKLDVIDLDQSVETIDLTKPDAGMTDAALAKARRCSLIIMDDIDPPINDDALIREWYQRAILHRPEDQS